MDELDPTPANQKSASDSESEEPPPLPWETPSEHQPTSELAAPELFVLPGLADMARRRRATSGKADEGKPEAAIKDVARSNMPRFPVPPSLNPSWPSPNSSPQQRPGPKPRSARIGIRGAEEASSWIHGFADFLAPPSEIYEQVTENVRAREIPRVNFRRVLWQEGGLFSDSREYLRIQWKRHVYDVCAAPFGGTYFMSSRLLILPRSVTPFQVLGAILTALIAAMILYQPSLLSIKPTPEALGIALAVVVAGLIIMIANPPALVDLRDVLVGMTIVGIIFELKRKPTYYEIDVAQMFNGIVHQALLDTIDGINIVKGFKPLGLEDRKPTLRKFFNR